MLVTFPIRGSGANLDPGFLFSASKSISQGKGTLTSKTRRSFLSLRNFYVFAFSFSFLLTINSAEAGKLAERRALKKQCKDGYNQCKEEKSKSACFQEKKDCRRENGVSIGDDVKFLLGEAKEILNKTLGKVKIAREEDAEFGYYTKISLEAAYLKFMPVLSVQHPDFQSYVSIAEDTKTKYLEFYIYDSDLKLDNYVVPLQTTPGRKFPRFFDGREFDFLTGVQYSAKNGKAYQFYFDSAHDVFGTFLPSKIVGEAIKSVNYVKSYIPYVGMLLPEVTTVPINLKYQGVKVGRASLIGQKSFENSAGIVVLFDHAIIAQTF